jgi:hypothetical protein
VKITARIAAWARPWRVPSPAELAAMSDDEAMAAYAALRRARARDAVVAEAARRDQADREAARTARAQERRAKQREEYDMHVYVQWLAAEEACKGYLLSKAGREADINPPDLWPMNEARAMRLASEELRDWWARHGRITYVQWRAMSREQRPELVSA